MGLLRSIYYILVSGYAIFLLVNNLPNLLDIEPKAYNPIFVNYEGGLALNNDLDNSKFILEKEVVGPECLEFKNGGLYASLSNGKIVVSTDLKTVKVVADTSTNLQTNPSRPAGFRFLKDDMYVADVGRGLLKVDVKTGKVIDLVLTSELVQGIPLGIANDLDIDEEGTIYFSDFNTKWSHTSVFFGIFERGNNGRVLTYNIHSGKSGVLVDKLVLPNGIQLTHDKKSLLISEFGNHRILRYYLQGPKKGQTEVFAQLPGEVDNIRPSSQGGYWVAMMTSRNASSPHLIDRLAPYPGVRKAIARLGYLLGTILLKIDEMLPTTWIASTGKTLHSGGHLMGLWSFDHAVVVELGEDGSIVRSLHSDNPKMSLLSQCTEHDGNLYIGSFLHDRIIKVEL